MASNGDSNLIGNGANMQIARVRLGNNIVFVGAHFAHGAVGKRVGIVANVGTFAAIERNIVEGSTRSFGQISRVSVTRAQSTPRATQEDTRVLSPPSEPCILSPFFSC